MVEKYSGSFEVVINFIAIQNNLEFSPSGVERLKEFIVLEQMEEMKRQKMISEIPDDVIREIFVVRSPDCAGAEPAAGTTRQ